MNIDTKGLLYDSPEDRKLFMKAGELAFDTAAAEGLQLIAFVSKTRLSYGSAVGLCNTGARIISIVIRHRQDKQDGGVWYSRPLPWKDICETVLHEVAHLRYPNHSKEFRAYEKLLINKYSR